MDRGRKKSRGSKSVSSSTTDSWSTQTQGSKNGKQSMSKLLSNIRGVLSTEPIKETMDLPSRSPTPPRSYYRKYWIEPKERRRSASSSLPRTVEEQEAASKLDKVVPAIMDNMIAGKSKSNWVDSSAFYIRDACVIEMLEADYYWYDNERARREEEKRMHYACRRKHKEEQHGSSLMETLQKGAALAAWAWLWRPN